MMRSLVPVLSAALLASVGLVGCKKNPPAPEAKEPGASAKKDHDDEPEEHEELPTSVRLPAEVLASAGIRTAVVTKKPLPATVDLTGEVVADPDHVTKVAARVPGRIVEVRFKEGERVKAGAVLAVIESAELARMRATFAASQARARFTSTSSKAPLSTANSVIAISETLSGEYCGCFISSVTRRPRSSCLRVASSRSEANCANAASSRYWARARRTPPPSFLMTLVWAAPPTRDTEIPALMAGRIPALKRSVSRKIWPSVIEITLVGTNAETSPAWVSITGRAVSEPVLPLTSPLVYFST